MNISSIKTPGVYINEIDAFPQSVASVATAIPAFIGYTELSPARFVPTKIASLLEFNQYFGGAPEPEAVHVQLDANSVPTDDTYVEQSAYNLYNSLELFYTNGGGECYIVSIGGYTVGAPMLKQDFISGIQSLEKFDEPTLLLFPDAVSLNTLSPVQDLAAIQQEALLQAQTLMDRFVIMDVIYDPSKGIDEDTTNFRTAIGTKSLKYGAAYYPYLVTNFQYQFNFAQINQAVGGFVTLYPEATYPQLYAEIIEYLKVNTDVGAINGRAEDAILNISGDASDSDLLSADLDTLYNLLAVFGPTAQANSTTFKEYWEDQIVDTKLKGFLQNLSNIVAAYDDLSVLINSTATPVTPVSLESLTGKFSSVWGNSIPVTPSTTNPYNGKLSTDVGSDKIVNWSKVNAELKKLATVISTAYQNSLASVNNYNSNKEGELTAQMPVYSSIVAKLNQSLSTTPPSGAVAGIYAQTDANRGVWKAPANVSISGIVGLTDDINDSEQATMNISDTGKSINAIRKFTGQGFVVWGARTLDGNSNDWRYINVRRLANMIEESVKKACNYYVFEPNTAQTWVNVKGMIESYLTSIWNDGGLAGAKAEQAFFVSIGLNQTMTAQDINEGRMIVKVGYAPSRPAEFIIVEFKQMLQQS